MRFLVILTAVLALLYAGYWFVGRSTVETGLRDSLRNLEAQGWRVDYDDLSTRGFPSRFDSTVTGLTLGAPGGEWVWQAPFLQLFALSYRPNRVIAVWPETQSLQLGGQVLDIASQSLRASAAVAPSPAIPLQNLTVEAAATTITSDLGWRIAFDRALLALRAADAGSGADAQAHLYDLYADASGLTPPAGFAARIDPEGTLPASLGTARIDARIGLDRPLDRQAGGLPLIETLDLRQMQFDWGGIALGGSGSLTVDRSGLPEGRITLELQGWEQIITLAVNGGLIDPGVAPTWRNVAMALAAGGGDLLELPVVFSAGRMSVGPLPLGPAPRLVLGPR